MESEKPVEQSKEAKEAPKPAAKPQGSKMAVVLIRNTTGASGSVRDTLKMLKLGKKFTCTVFDKTSTITGMLEKVKDYTTYGEIDDTTLKMINDKRGKKDAEGKLKSHFHLHPPLGGFERKGVKHSFTQGGVLGYRGAKMNELIKKML